MIMNIIVEILASIIVICVPIIMCFICYFCFCLDGFRRYGEGDYTASGDILIVIIVSFLTILSLGVSILSITNNYGPYLKGN
jgi:hypothetical protein